MNGYKNPSALATIKNCTNYIMMRMGNSTTNKICKLEERAREPDWYT